jgi:CRP/FNR family transcriptional regulator, anaerobic regulatory protein
MDAHEKLLQAFNRLIPLTPSQKDELRRVTSFLELPKGSLLLERGQISNHLYFIIEGAIRSIYYHDEKEVVPWFAFEGDIINSHFSFVHRIPTQESIILISDCKFLSISHESMQYLYNKDPVWGHLSRIFVERYYIDVQQRLISFLSVSADERYEQLLLQHPNIEARVKQCHIASYLGIRPETLSALRRRRSRKSQRRPSGSS